MDVIKKRGLIIKNLMCMCAGWVGVCRLGWCVWVGLVCWLGWCVGFFTV